MNLAPGIALHKLEYTRRRGGSPTRDVFPVKPLIPFIQGVLGQSQVGKLRLTRNAHQQRGPEHRAHSLQLSPGPRVRPGLFLICPVPAIHRHLACGFDGAFPIVRKGPDNVLSLNVAKLPSRNVLELAFQVGITALAF